jgi:hypothetical protein
MYEFLLKKGQTLAFIVGTVITVIFMGLAVSGINNAGLAGADLTTMKEEIPNMNYFNFGLYATMALIIICFGLLVIFLLLDIVKFPKQMGKSLLAVVGLVIVFVVLTMTSEVETGGIWDRLMNNPDFAFTPGVSKFISGGLKITGLLTIVAVGIMIFQEIRNAFK